MDRRHAVLAATLPAPAPGLPGLGDLDLAAFLTRFDAAAPWHLRVGFAVAAWMLGVALPRVWTGRSLAALDADAADAVLVRADRSPLWAPLVFVVKTVATFAYFDDDAAHAAVRDLA